MGLRPAASTASASMKLEYRSPMRCASVRAAELDSAASVMMVCTSSSALS
ncbi:Uncharacterised protein [Mycobacteroides abscessus subsp. abscessus]|nr:Uncharacterised protein [Mycobacteroides abscessus subsp. abscessus]